MSYWNKDVVDPADWSDWKFVPNFLVFTLKKNIKFGWLKANICRIDYKRHTQELKSIAQPNHIGPAASILIAEAALTNTHTKYYIQHNQNHEGAQF